MADNPQAGQGRPLPKKENDLFKNVVKQYEQKQYKKAIKHADAILKKYPNHGETLAMKGLIYNNMGGEKKEESQALVKQGLMNDMRYANVEKKKTFAVGAMVFILT
jgi:peptide alpha-N-acetyltransferase